MSIYYKIHTILNKNKYTKYCVEIKIKKGEKEVR